MLTGWHVILTLKIAVVAVTLLLFASLTALAMGNYRLHGRINIAFFALTAVAILSLEVLVRVVDPGIFDYLDESTRQALRIHLGFALPAAAILPAMLFTGLTHRSRVHRALSIAFGVLWAGTFVTGVFFLPHSAP